MLVLSACDWSSRLDTTPVSRCSQSLAGAPHRDVVRPRHNPRGCQDRWARIPWPRRFRGARTSAWRLRLASADDESKPQAGAVARWRQSSQQQLLALRRRASTRSSNVSLTSFARGVWHLQADLQPLTGLVFKRLPRRGSEAEFAQSASPSPVPQCLLPVVHLRLVSTATRAEEIVLSPNGPGLSPRSPTCIPDSPAPGAPSRALEHQSQHRRGHGRRPDQPGR